MQHKIDKIINSKSIFTQGHALFHTASFLCEKNIQSYNNANKKLFLQNRLMPIKKINKKKIQFEQTGSATESNSMNHESVSHFSSMDHGV